MGLFWRSKTDAEFQRELDRIAATQEQVSEEEYSASIDKEQEILRKEGMLLFRARIQQLCKQDKNTAHKLSREQKRKVGWRSVLMERMGARCWSDVNVWLEDIIEGGDFDTFYEDVWEQKHLSALGLNAPISGGKYSRDRDGGESDSGLRWRSYSTYVSVVEREQKQRDKFVRGDYDNSGVYRQDLRLLKVEEKERNMSASFLSSIGVKTTPSLQKAVKQIKKNQMEIDRNAWADIVFQVHKYYIEDNALVAYTENVKNALHGTGTGEMELRLRKNNLPLMFGKKSALYFTSVKTTEILEQLTNGIRTGELDGAIRSHRLRVNRAKKKGSFRRKMEVKNKNILAGGR